MLASYPEVTQVVAQVGRPDDGTDTTGFNNTEYYVDLKPKEEWRPKFHQDKEEMIADMDRQLQKIPGVVWGFSQPIADDMDEAMSGVKGELAVKIYGDDLKILEEKADEMVNVMRTVPGINDLGVFHVTGQPNLDCDRGPRRGGPFSDQCRGCAGRHPNRGRWQPRHVRSCRASSASIWWRDILQGFRDTREGIENIRLLSPSGERVSLAQLCTIQIKDGASQLYRESNSRYVAIRYSVRGRDLGGTVEEAIRKINERCEASAALQYCLGGRV